MNFLAFIGPALRILNRGINVLADKSDDYPNASGSAAIVAAGSAWLGIDPTTRAAIGKVIVTLGQMLQ